MSERFVVECEFCGQELLSCDPDLQEDGTLPGISARALLAHWNAEPRCGKAVANHHGIRKRFPAESGQLGGEISDLKPTPSTDEKPEKGR